MFLYACAMLFGLLPGAYIGPINPYATTFKLITQTIGTARQMYTALYQAYYTLDFITTPQIKLNFGGEISGRAKAVLNWLGFGLQLSINVYTIPISVFFLAPAQAIAGFLTDGIMILYAEYYLMVFFSVAAIPVFLIPGTIFRALFPTRALGGMLIAFAIGFYLIMPSLFSVAYYFTSQSVQRDMAVATLQMLTLPVNPDNAVSASSPLVVQLFAVKSSLTGFWLLILFYPSLIITITYTAIQEISNFIGRASSVRQSLRFFI